MRIDSYDKVITAKSNASSPIPKMDAMSEFLKYIYIPKKSDSYSTDPKKTSKDIYPDDFFNVQNPQAVYVEVDIKTSKNDWRSLSAEQNNFFKDLKIEDSGGAKKFTLSLFDREFYNLEELISGTVAFSQTSYNYLDEDREEYSKEAISIKSELTSEQVDALYEQRVALLNKVLIKRESINPLNLNPDGRPSSVASTTYPPSNYETTHDWKDSYPDDTKISSKTSMEILSQFTKIYKDYIRVKEDKLPPDFKEGDKMLFASFEAEKALNFVRQNTEEYKRVLGSVCDTTHLTDTMLYAYLVEFITYLFTNDGRDFTKIRLTMSEYIIYTNKALNNLKTEISNINNAEISYIKQNADKIEASHNLIQLIEMKNEVEPNIRIRFGYTDQNYGGAASGANARYAENATELGVKVAQTNNNENVNISYKNRANTKSTMIRGPYYHFLITGVQSRISKEGLYYTLSGFSMSSMKFDKFKLVQKFAKLKGTASEILAGLFITFNEKLQPVKDTTGIKAPIRLLMDSKAYDYINSYYDNKEVEIALGSESCIGNTTSYKSIRSLFNDICSVFPKKEKIESNSKPIKIMTSDTEGNAGEIEKTKTSDLYPLSYYIKDGVDIVSNDGTTKYEGIEVIFYYKEPTKSEYCRVYDWGMTRNTIVKDLEINNKNEYAALASFSMYDKNDKEFTIDDFSNTAVGNKLKATNYTNDFILTNQVLENPNNTARLRLRNAINNSLINSLYEGSITIPGDPFYSFDDNVVPYCYPIKINVWRPSGRKGSSNNEYERKDSSGEPVLSYVSGYYVLTSITHNIGLSGYTTTLGIMKYPGIEDTLS